MQNLRLILTLRPVTIDRLFLPGKSFKYRKDSVFWDKLLKGKTGHIITTMDEPWWYYWLVYRSPGIKQLKRSVLYFCGIKPVKVTTIGIVKTANEEKRKQWIKLVYCLGKKCSYSITIIIRCKPGIMSGRSGKKIVKPGQITLKIADIK